MGPPNEVIRRARTLLGLSEAEAARRSGLSVSEYFDLELHEDEALTVVRLDKLKLLCRALNLDLLDLLSIEHGDVQVPEAVSAQRTARRSDLIRSRRTALGMSKEDLGERLGFDTSVVALLETDPDYLEGWSAELVLDLSEAIGVAPQCLVEWTGQS
jgi:transcriptional regulator with XRE-family HTH domain